MGLEHSSGWTFLLPFDIPPFRFPALASYDNWLFDSEQGGNKKLY